MPDIAGRRRGTMSEYTNVPSFTVPPDRVRELLPRSTRRIDQNEGRTIYSREGVSRLWFVDPDTRTLEAFELGGMLARLADFARVFLPPFDAIAFPLDAPWQPHPPAAEAVREDEDGGIDGASFLRRTTESGMSSGLAGGRGSRTSAILGAIGRV